MASVADLAMARVERSAMETARYIRSGIDLGGNPDRVRVAFHRERQEFSACDGDGCVYNGWGLLPRFQITGNPEIDAPAMLRAAERWIASA